MSKLENIQVSSLKLDLSNYRTVHQKSETNSINAMIAISPDWFWSLMESIIEDGYYPTDNIIVLKTKKGLFVKEGNRRIASLKIIHGYIKGIEVPENIKSKIAELDSRWKNKNSSIPCAIYQESEIETVKKLVSLIHAKGEKAGREKWTSVAKARYERDEKKNKELGLDILEKYLVNGKNLTANQRESWGGDYPITVLDDLLPKLYPYLGFESSDAILKEYPAKKRTIIEKILNDIGAKTLGFSDIRNKPFWGIRYGLSENKGSTQGTPNNPSGTGNTDNGQAGNGSDDEPYKPPKAKAKKVAYSLTDVKSVYKKLKNFKPIGDNREKVVSLLEEIKRLKIDAHPFSFCFLLRSMFEISAKVFSQDHKASGLTITKSDGNDKELSNLLRDIVGFMTPDKKDREKLKLLHGALTELNKKDGILSVTSFNQLIHNPKFSIQPTDICIVFHNIFPLLEEMNN
jgi:hypothetical protein